MTPPKATKVFSLTPEGREIIRKIIDSGLLDDYQASLHTKNDQGSSMISVEDLTESEKWANSLFVELYNAWIAIINSQKGQKRKLRDIGSVMAYTFYRCMDYLLSDKIDTTQKMTYQPTP